MGQFVDAVILTVSALFPIMNPFSTAPLFASLTADFDDKKRTQQALMGCIYAFGILITFLLIGSAIINFFGISISGIQVAGGLIISTIGFRMLFPASPVSAQSITKGEDPNRDYSFTPLAMPSLAGPGAISVVLTGSANIKLNHPDDWMLVYIPVITGLVITVISAFIILRAAGSMVRFLGRSGVDAMTRIFGFLLICIGMQYLLNGINTFFAIRPA